MNIPTKFDMGQLVHVLTHGRCEKVAEECPTCLGTGSVNLLAEAFICPKCSGKKQLFEHRYGWYVGQSSCVGHVRAETRQPDEDDERAVHVAYMIHATGIGSGTVHQEDRLWGGTREDAQAECSRRNEAGEWP